MEQSETKSRLPYSIFPHKLYDKCLCYRNFPIDFVSLRNDWALAKAGTEHKQKKLRHFFS